MAEKNNNKNKAELLSLLETLEKRKKYYQILKTKLQPHQEQVIPAIEEKLPGGIPKYKFILYQGGNGSGKTFTAIFITVLLAIGAKAKSYSLPYIGTRKNIWIVTKSSSNVSSVIDPYLLGDESKTRIPPELIEKITRDNQVLKEIKLTNGTKISIKTYDQGRERLQGGNPDFILVDEEPVDKGVWEELMVRVREPKSQILLAMTPLSGLTPVYSFFYENNQASGEEERRKIFRVSSLDNKHADHSGLQFLSEQDKLMRIYGNFVPPSGLVYSSFNRDNIVPHFNPKLLGEGTRYYGGIDFGITHPTGFVLVAVDEDDQIYAFDGFLQAGLLIEDMANKIKDLISSYGIELEYIVGDSAAKRERTELAKLGVKTIPADKWSKGESGESNRKAGILKVNQLFASSKLYVSSGLEKSLIKELETHHYKESSRDGDVVKEGDDIIDALRYLIWAIKPNKTISSSQERFEKKWGTKYNNKHYYKKNYKQPY